MSKLLPELNTCTAVRVSMGNLNTMIRVSVTEEPEALDGGVLDPGVLGSIDIREPGEYRFELSRQPKHDAAVTWSFPEAPEGFTAILKDLVCEFLYEG